MKAQKMIKCGTCGDHIKDAYVDVPPSHGDVALSKCDECLDKAGEEYPPCICAALDCSGERKPCRGDCGCDCCRMGYQDFLDYE
jgi:hypothetical protein